jgi:hypothetical protein
MAQTLLAEPDHICAVLFRIVSGLANRVSVK